MNSSERRREIRKMLVDNELAIYAAKQFAKACQKNGQEPPLITKALVDIFERLDAIND